MMFTKEKSWVEVSKPESLYKIHEEEINVAILNREIRHLSDEVHDQLGKNVQVRVVGNIDSILETLKEALGASDESPLLQDIRGLIEVFQELSGSKEFKIFLSSVNNDMCRRFHTDINDIRMLCTYDGPGTLWLTEDNVNRDALNSGKDNDLIVINQKKIQQAKTGSVIILKGATYPKEGTKAAVHRSPTIEESGRKRLLLRIDTNGGLNF